MRMAAAARHPATTTASMKVLAAAAAAAAACFVLLFLINVAESRAVAAGAGDGDGVSKGHHHDHDHGHGHHGGGGDTKKKKKRSTHKLFVFGDEFADVGNLSPDDSLGFYSRSWRPPFGASDAAHGREPTGRFSDGLVQSDYVAKIMGHAESPPPYNSDGWGDAVDASGMNFATAGAAVLRRQQLSPEESRAGVLRLHSQVNLLRDLVSDGVLLDSDFDDSVALVAFSSNDYAAANSDDVFEGLIPWVVGELESVVAQLQDIGVSKVVVNTLPPFGCSPWLARGNNYTACLDSGNDGPRKHNAALRDRLLGGAGGGDDGGGVMVLDVYTVMMDMVAPPAEGSELSARFKERLQPCCESYGDGGDGDGDDSGGSYCGDPQARYWLCDRPEDYFYWDFVNPTQAGWRAVMQMLQGPIMAFLGISQLNHF